MHCFPPSVQHRYLSSEGVWAADNSCFYHSWVLYQGTLHFKWPDAIPRQGKIKMRFGCYVSSGKTSTNCFLIVTLKKKSQARTNQQPTMEALGEVGKLAGLEAGAFHGAHVSEDCWGCGSFSICALSLGLSGWSSIPPR